MFSYPTWYIRYQDCDGETAYAVARRLVEKKLVAVKTVEDFFDLVEALEKEL